MFMEWPAGASDARDYLYHEVADVATVVLVHEGVPGEWESTVVLGAGVIMHPSFLQPA